jgi:hypothetical protein
MVTIDQMASNALSALGEDPNAPVYWTRGEVIQAAQWGVRLFCALTMCYERSVTVTVPAGVAIDIRTLIPDFLFPFRLVANGKRLRTIDFAELGARDEQWPLATGTPTHYRLGGISNLTLYPPTGVALTFEYAAEPTTAAGDTIQVPDEDLRPIENWTIACSRWKQGGQELAKEMYRMQTFVMAMRRRAELVRRRGLAAGFDSVPPEDSRYELSTAMTLPKPAKLPELKVVADAS